MICPPSVFMEGLVSLGSVPITRTFVLISVPALRTVISYLADSPGLTGAFAAGPLNLIDRPGTSTCVVDSALS